MADDISDSPNESFDFVVNTIEGVYLALVLMCFLNLLRGNSFNVTECSSLCNCKGSCFLLLYEVR